MSEIFLVIAKQSPQSQAYEQLTQQLQYLKGQLFINHSYDTYYRLVGASREHMLKTFDLVILFIHKVHQMHQDNKVNSQVVTQLFKGVTDYLRSENYKKYSLCERAVFLLEIETKIGSCMQAFNTLLNEKFETNITNSSKEAYKNVWDCIQVVKQENKQKIKDGHVLMKKIIILTTTAIMIEANVEWLLIKKILFGLSYPRYLVDFNTARLKSLFFFKFPTIKMTKEIWNIPEGGWSKELLKLTFQKIQFHQKIYIPLEELSDNEFPDIYTPNRNAIKVRVLHYKNLKMKDKISKACCGWNFLKSTIKHEKIDTIMIHMHGGGFIALSSRMMQPMTRRWAKELKIPIFSIDYRKPPNHPFPAATNDCLTVYKFILKKISYYMDIQPKHIYLAGDSAGGNLACALMGNILIQKLPKPLGIYLVYPTLDIRSHFTSSKVNSLMDPLLWPSMLELILREYLGFDLSLQSHPLASPLLLTQSFVGGNPDDNRFPLQWPKTFISAGQKDTFFDDSLILMQKLKNSNVECYCRVYPQFCHGYMSTMIMMRECYLALDDSVKDLKRLVHGK